VQYLTLLDWVLTPFYFAGLYLIAKYIRDKRYKKGHPLRQYYLPGLMAKFGGAIFIALIYQYYYEGGDTYNYFTHSKIINSSLDESFDTWSNLILRASPEQVPTLYKYTSQMEWYNDVPSYTVAVIGALFGLLCGTNYLPMALMFAFLSYTGIWAMFRTFAQIYPRLHRELAIVFLFIPSTIVWGSSVFKDTVCMFGLGWMTWCTFRAFINRDLSISNLLMLVISFYLVVVIKIYIILAFLPALALWLLMNYTHRIGNKGLRFLVNVAVIGAVAGVFLYASSLFSQELNKYSLENVSKTVDLTRDWITFASGDEGSAYDIGEFDGSVGSTLQMFPAGVTVTLFRPFPWEIKKIIVALSALEALVFTFFTLSLFFKRGVRLVDRLRDPNVIFCLLFALIFAFAVGISSGNFGALSRYKIPCLPFYGAFLVICLYYEQRKREAVYENKATKEASLA
jgi:hypothetical protein